MARAIDADALDVHSLPMDMGGCVFIDDVTEMIANAPTIEAEPVKQKWISVKEELPKKQRDYLCVCQFGDDPSWRWPLVLMFYPDKNGDNGYVKGPHFADEGLNDMRVVYWMHIQKLPKE